MATGQDLPFGRKLADVINEQNNPTPPVPPEPVPNNPVIETPNKGTTPPTPPANTGATATPPPPEPPKNEWLGEVNKSFKTDFKSPEEFGQVFEKAKKVDEYNTKVKGYEESEKKYQQQLAELQSSLNPLTYFSSQESYVAEQLRKQHPDKSPYILQEVVTSDNKKMDDLDVLVKNQMLETPNLIGGENGAKEYILEKYGIDPNTPKEEWSMATRNKILIEANAARRTWDELKGQVKLPEIATPEQKEASLAKQREEKIKALTPLKETFSKFDKYSIEIEPGKVLDFNVPDEYKQSLPDMFETYFVDAGLEADKDSLAQIEVLKEALLLHSNIKQIYKLIEGDVETRMKAERDALLGNVNPSNTQTATGVEDEKVKFSNEHGLGKFVNK
jgi:hypothetical protein